MKKIIILLSIFLVSCGEETKQNNPKELNESLNEVAGDTVASEFKYVPGESINVESLSGNIDLNMDISQLSLSDIRILRNAFAARQGYCFMKADLRAVFSTTTWYDQRMNDRYWEEEGGNISPISYTNDETSFIDKLKARENELTSNNYGNVGGREMANLDNIVNLFQLENPNLELMNMLGKNGFAIVPNNGIQLFHTYEENDYQQFPNFVTTDMYMQLFHMYFGYVLRSVEEEKFIPLLEEICMELKLKNEEIASVSKDERIKDAGFYNAAYYAIAYTSLTGKKIEVKAGYSDLYEQEIKHINDAADRTSEFLDYLVVDFPYSLYKPRGHYTRTEALKRYFKSMMWLQTAPFCLDNDKHLQRAALSSSFMIEEGLHRKYKALMEPITFIIGEPDNVSFLNLAEIIQKGNYDVNAILTNQGSLESLRKQVKKVADAQNKIKPKEPGSCIDKINFVPQRYLADNEVLQELVDEENNVTKRGYPKGLDIMAAFGSGSAENVLLNELKEGENWPDYTKRLNELKGKMKDVNPDATVYNKWISSLLELQKPNTSYPYFMQTAQWQKKDLNASLSSWAELKHDAILYAEQPMGAECGGGGPPEPYTVGYVEPNVNYWKAVIELVDLTQEVLEKNNLMTSDIQRTTKSMRENAEFLLIASKKELNGEKLTENEYDQIEYIGSTFEWLTLDFVKQKDEYLEGWDNVKGPDKSVAVIADIYTANMSNNPDKGVLHVATGNVNDIFVVVEIEGYLYLTKGAVFSYNEFHVPMGNRLTDEEWQEMLEKNEAPEMPSWIKEIILPIESPKSNEKIFYSSGC
jgi:hypothetical protein